MGTESPPPAARRRPGPATPRELGRRELHLVSDLVLHVAPEWSVELSGDAPTDRSVVVMPQAADDMVGPTFVIRATPTGVRLDQVQWDQYSTILDRSNLRHVLSVLRARLRVLSTVTRPPNAVLH